MRGCGWGKAAAGLNALGELGPDDQASSCPNAGGSLQERRWLLAVGRGGSGLSDMGEECR